LGIGFHRDNGCSHDRQRCDKCMSGNQQINIIDADCQTAFKSQKCVKSTATQIFDSSRNLREERKCFDSEETTARCFASSAVDTTPRCHRSVPVHRSHEMAELPTRQRPRVHSDQLLEFPVYHLLGRSRGVRSSFARHVLEFLRFEGPSITGRSVISI
jgi:hypothetical protein